MSQVETLGSPINSIWAAPLLSALFIGLSVGIKKCLGTTVGQVLVCSVISSLNPSSSFFTGHANKSLLQPPSRRGGQKAAHWSSRHTVIHHTRTSPGGLKSRETWAQSFQVLRPLWWEKPHYHARTVASISHELTGLFSFLLNTQRHPTYMRSRRPTNHGRKNLSLTTQVLKSTWNHFASICFAP